MPGRLGCHESQSNAGVHYVGVKLRKLSAFSWVQWHWLVLISRPCLLSGSPSYAKCSSVQLGLPPLPYLQKQRPLRGWKTLQSKVWVTHQTWGPLSAFARTVILAVSLGLLYLSHSPHSRMTLQPLGEMTACGIVLILFGFLTLLLLFPFWSNQRLSAHQLLPQTSPENENRISDPENTEISKKNIVC